MEQHDPMCSVPVSYLNMLQGQGSSQRVAYTAIEPTAANLDTLKAIESGVTRGTYTEMRDRCDRLQIERDEALLRIHAFEERAGCALEHIPVEKLNAAQDAHVMQSAVDELKRENERLGKECNALGSELCDWRGKYKEVARELASTAPVKQKPFFPTPEEAAPYGRKKDGTPKAKPGRKVPRRRKAA